jgi:hypothetical protein
MADKKQTIKCDVDDCKYYSNENLCTLKEIKVCHCDCEDEHEDTKNGTICHSYKCGKDKD